MPTADANGIRIEYETFGDPSAPPVLLIMGQGGQLLSWDEPFCRTLASRGLRVIRYDNRDIGLSTKFDDAPIPDGLALLNGAPAPYTVEDMADDAIGLLDALGVERAHLVGQSMGGFIAQVLALRDRQRILSLTLIMSGAGGDALETPKESGLARMTMPPVTSRDEYAQRAVNEAHVINPGFPVDGARARRIAKAKYDRSYYPDGEARHLSAAIVSPNRVEALRTLRLPALIVHGEADDILPVGNAHVLAGAIPDAELMVIPGMGHDLVPEVFDRVADAIYAISARSPTSSS